jgi:hypothetical protein
MRAWPGLLLTLLSLPQALAQGPGGEIRYANQHTFRIPFDVGAGKERLKQLQLFYSTDQGRTWQPGAIAAPDQTFFQFVCERDGLYWFTVQTLDKEGRYYPPTLDSAQPSLKVIVDTQPPQVQLRPLPARQGLVGVAWEVRDDNLDLRQPGALILEYRPVGSVGWLALPVEPALGQHYWDPRSAGPLEVRLRVRDLAGNLGEGKTTVLAGEGTAGTPPGAAPLPATYPAPAERRFVNSRRIRLHYELKDVGPSGVSAIELWCTQDGRSWNRCPLPKGESDGPPRPLVFEVPGEGIYGFTLLARSGVGLSERPPQIGDPPQVWVEVDLTKPVVQILDVQVGQGPDKGKLTITWTAQDKNLAQSPITLSYAQQATGPWTTIAEHLVNTGRYVWQMPEQIPYQFYVRVQAVDLAGNVGEAITRDLVRVDLSLPHVRILSVDPAQH